MITEKLILDRDILLHKAEKEAEKREKKAKENAMLEVAKNLFSMGMTIEQIKNATNLPLNKIKGLQPKN
jgi:predicted transposase/invertase (TIGR01784 family)